MEDPQRKQGAKQRKTDTKRETAKRPRTSGSLEKDAKRLGGQAIRE